VQYQTDCRKIKIKQKDNKKYTADENSIKKKKTRKEKVLVSS
jgi:hypothetical protein